MLALSGERKALSLAGLGSSRRFWSRNCEKVEMTRTARNWRRMEVSTGCGLGHRHRQQWNVAGFYQHGTVAHVS